MLIVSIVNIIVDSDIFVSSSSSQGFNETESSIVEVGMTGG